MNNILYLSDPKPINMRTKLLFAAMAAALSGTAQITLLAAYHEPTLGVTGDTPYDSTNHVMPHNTGANCTWNFSALSTTSTPNTSTFVTVSSTPSSSNFPTATIANDGGMGAYAYFQSSPNKFELLGLALGTTVVNYSNPQTIFTWPLSYSSNNNFSDTYAYSMIVSGMTLTTNGALTTSVTGYGTLTLPGGQVLNDVLQLRSVESESLTNSIVPGTNTAVTISVYYFHASQRYPVLTYSEYRSQNGTSTDVSGEYMVNHLLAVALKEQTDFTGLRIYPNPAKSTITIDANLKKPVDFSVSVENIVGQSLISFKADASIRTHQVDVSSLPAGVYLLKVSDGSDQVVRRLIIE